MDFNELWNSLSAQGKIYVVCTMGYFFLMLIFLVLFLSKINKLIAVMSEIKNKLP